MRLEVVYVMVDPLPSKTYRVGALNLGGYEIRSHSGGYDRTTLASYRPFWLVMASRRYFILLILLEWVLVFSELPSSLDGSLTNSVLECSSSLVCAEDELSPSFCLSLDFLEGVLALSFFFLSSSNYESICLRLSIDSCWAQIISSYSLWA